MSSYYEVVPQSLLNRLCSDPGLLAAFESLWGHGSGMYSWFDELSNAEIDEITDGLPLSSSAIEELRSLLSNAEVFPTAYIEKTHDLHEAILCSAFAKAGAPNPSGLARVVVLGDGDWCYGAGFGIVGSQRCREIATLMERFAVADLVNDYDLGDKEPRDAWLEDLTSEFQSLVNCYSAAGNHRHSVLTRIT